MTKEKAEKEANNYKIDLCAYCRECGKGNCSHTDDAIFGFKDGYKIGLAEGRKETFALYNTEVDDIAKDYAERLRKFEEENKKLKEKLKGFEIGDVCWRKDMDATIKQNLELKEELEELKEKHESNKRALKLIIEKGVELEKENKVLKDFIRDLIYENSNACYHFNNTTCLFNSDYRNRAEELIGEKL